MELNSVIEKLPKHLLDFVVDQPYESYTPQDHAVWRYVMRQNVSYLSKVAHSSYLEGLKATGIDTDKIPSIYGMNRILREIGWAAVTVDGFIPPSAFMEFQAYKVLVIAADIRPIDQIEYTPAPDIIHEAAGHAPIIANPEYAEYLRYFGEIGAKAFSSRKDYELYEAIRHLSIIKADPYTPQADILHAEENLRSIELSMGDPSEMALIRNLHWWTVEYGLIGDLNNPKIYGAGLLSSIGESINCLKDDVIKLPYTLDAVNYSFDITTQQPQLFVTPDFETLNKVLKQFVSTMAISLGGADAVNKAINSGNTATLVLDSGLQISGTIGEAIIKDGNPIFIKSSSPTALAYNGKQIDGHGLDYHNHGFSSPIGRINGLTKSLFEMNDSDLEENGILEGKNVVLNYESGVRMNGTVRSILRHDGRNLILSLIDCTVKYEDKVLFDPSWGVFDLVIGDRIVSGYSGPADPLAFGLSFTAPSEKTHKINYSDKDKQLHSLYLEVRNLRSHGLEAAQLKSLWEEVRINFPDDWLLPMEILELAKESEELTILSSEVRDYLLVKSKTRHELSNLIENGLKLIY